MTRPRRLTHGRDLRLAFRPLYRLRAGTAPLPAGPAGQVLLRPVRPLEHRVALSVRAGDVVTVGGPTVRTGSRSVLHAHTHLHVAAPVLPDRRPAGRPVPRPGRLRGRLARSGPADQADPVPVPGPAPSRRHELPQRLHGTVPRPGGAPGPARPPALRPRPAPATRTVPVVPATPRRAPGTGPAPVPRRVARPVMPVPPAGGAVVQASTRAQGGPGRPGRTALGQDRPQQPVPIDIDAVTRQVITTIERRERADRERRGHGPGG
ncbi:hypothetical protein FE251_08400 [Georgenia wutianyii]|uniref:Uncharacterized protein n=1 Tax=Georgenia wutianyii TaxID=2585135 RepID=A0ABX5VPR9_9MICO|nr:hypothetical protein [Georgenia wutianyii]QDB79388.1 hypothetical protein FE251_08400 [Georgenia wutianyii]